MQRGRRSSHIQAGYRNTASCKRDPDQSSRARTPSRHQADHEQPQPHVAPTYLEWSVDPSGPPPAHPLPKWVPRGNEGRAQEPRTGPSTRASDRCQGASPLGKPYGLIRQKKGSVTRQRSTDEDSCRYASSEASFVFRPTSSRRPVLLLRPSSRPQPRGRKEGDPRRRPRKSERNVPEDVRTGRLKKIDDTSIVGSASTPTEDVISIFSSAEERGGVNRLHIR